MFGGRGEEGLKREGTVTEKREKGILSNLEAQQVGGSEKRRVEVRMIERDQTEREKAGRNDKKRGELLSNLSINRCNRCNQLCVQVKREASQCQLQQSGSRVGQGLRALLCNSAACNSVISSISGSDIQMACSPTITPGLAHNDSEMEEMDTNTQAGKEEGSQDEEQKNLRKTNIRAVQRA